MDLNNRKITNHPPSHETVKSLPCSEHVEDRTASFNKQINKLALILMSIINPQKINLVGHYTLLMKINNKCYNLECWTITHNQLVAVGEFSRMLDDNTQPIGRSR